MIKTKQRTPERTWTYNLTYYNHIRKGQKNNNLIIPQSEGEKPNMALIITNHPIIMNISRSQRESLPELEVLH